MKLSALTQMERIMRDKVAKAAYNRQWEKLHPEKVQEYKRRNKEKCRERYRESARAYMALRRQDPVEREKLLQKTQLWRLKEKAQDYEKFRRRQRNVRLRREFGITVDDYDKMLMEQGGVCKICRRPPQKHRLAVDHDHRHKGNKKESIRGLLCHCCNRGLAWFRDNAESLDRAAKYLKKEL